MQRPKSSKLPSEYTLNELLDSVANNYTEDGVPVESTSNRSTEPLIDSDILTFIFDLDIKPGNKKVNKHVLYAMYKSWSIKPESKYKFGNFISQFFPANHISTCWLLNKDSLELTRTPHKIIQTAKTKTKSKNYKNHFESFLKYYNITTGNWYIKSYVLYFLYDKWTYKNNSRNPLGYKNFLSFCEIYFNQKRLESSRIMYFGINEDMKRSLHLTEEQLKIIHHWGQKFHETKTKKYKEKRKKKKTNIEGKD